MGHRVFQIKETDACLFELLKLGIGINKQNLISFNKLLRLSIANWENIMCIAIKHGVAAIAFDGVQLLYDAYQNKMKAAKDTPEEWTKWVLDCSGMMMQYEKRHKLQKDIIHETAEILGNESIKTMIFKGIAIASLYPTPSHRATGDIDCYLFGEAKKGDSILKAKGAKIDNRWYRHSKILFKGETIENHRVMSHTIGGMKRKEMEKELRLMVNSSRLLAIEGCGKALMPTTQFNACFLTYHAMHHFISEGLRMKQVLDWVMFLYHCQNDVDWEAYFDFCSKYKLDRFAAVMNYIATEYFDVDLKDNYNNDPVIAELAEKVMRSTLYCDDYLLNSGKSDWTVRLLLLKNMMGRDRWKYEELMQQSVWKRLWLSVTGYIFRRDEE